MLVGEHGITVLGVIACFVIMVLCFTGFLFWVGASDAGTATIWPHGVVFISSVCVFLVVLGIIIVNPHRGER